MLPGRFRHLGDVEQIRPVERAVLEAVVAAGGSISAEHGIGTAKARYLHLCRSPAEIRAFRAIKAALDPYGILNPHASSRPSDRGRSDAGPSVSDKPERSELGVARSHRSGHGRVGEAPKR